DLGHHRVAVVEAKALRRLTGPLEQRFRHAEKLELLAVADAVEVHHGDDAVELVALPRLCDEPARADQADLLGAEGDELQRARMRTAAEPLRYAAHPLDPGRVVDGAVPPPDRVVVGADDDDLVARAAQLRDNVAVAPPGDVRAAYDEARLLPVA